MNATQTIPGGSFTLDGGAWLAQPPSRCDLTMSQLADLLRLAIAGEPLPAVYSYTSAQDILSDLHLVAATAATTAERRAECEARAGAEARRAAMLAWQVIRAAGKRKTIRTEDVRAALSGENVQVESSAA